ncbi:MAG: alanine--tRNA ligase [Candidatus Izemoplasmatales bacterium]
MKYLSGNEIRNLWLEFFKGKGHLVEPGASLIPNDDPTLLWMNAGVAALKKYFDGSVIPKNPRIVNVQKCIRTNDIEHVGKTARHHTFFEMLGNFSIGDYFRDQALEWAYEWLTSEKWLGLPKEKLYITVYSADHETAEKWVALGIDSSHIVATVDQNFWEIGEGPSGPCTEIFFDRGEKYGDFSIEAIRDDIENDRFVEIWNIVLSQFNAKAGMKREEYPELPSKNIDTGSGLERVAMVVQEVETNYETDLFYPIIKKIEAISGIDYHGQMAFKVIADHIRTVSFAISDGAILSNEGRGYVLRRLLRRAVKYGRKLGIEKPFMAKLVDIVEKIMADFYPNIRTQKDLIKRIVSQEETKFLETLSQGEKRFQAIAGAKKNKIIPGKDAFLLYDTFGFPIELTIEYAEEIGYKVDTMEFEREMEKQKERARKARKEISSMKSQNEEYLEFKEPSEFIGYDTLLFESKIIKILKEGLVLDKTPFYATSGGQVADTGVVYNDDFSARITDVSKLPNGQHLHHYELVEGKPKEGAKVIAKVDEQRRRQITLHHSATHLLFKALRDQLGNHVSQQGSQVSDESLRFDFNHYELPSDDQILKLEKTVNEMIQEPFVAKTEILPIDQAVKKGAIAEFGEKYEGKVRTVNLKYTLDLCGGTHVDNLHNIERFAIRSVFSIGSGIYRTEALAGPKVDDLKEVYHNIEDNIEQIKHKMEQTIIKAKEQGIDLKMPDIPSGEETGSYQDIINKRQEFQLVQQLAKDLDKEFNRKKEQLLGMGIEKYLNDLEDGKLILSLEDTDLQTVKQLADNLANCDGVDIVFIASRNEDKLTFVAKSNDPKLHAGSIVKEAASLTGGSGGGKADFAQGGGKDPGKLDAALFRVRELLK